jgi:iron complex outermembrane receptor protein
LTAQRLIGGGVEISGSAFRNRLTDLLSRRTDTTSGSQYFGNVDEIHSRGLELGLNVNRGHGLTGKLSYSFQRTEDRASGIQLSNSPEQMVQMELRSPILGSGATASVDAQYMSTRSTLLGNIAGSHVLTNFSLFAPRTFGRFDLSASVYNVFDARYGDPVSNGFVQDLIQQDGRSFRVRTTLHY